MTRQPRLPRLAAWILRLMPLGEQRAESETDLAELYASRRDSAGRAYAVRRLIGDLLSVAVPRPRFGAIAQDLTYGIRLFRKHTGMVSVTVVGLGLAIAMCTTVFSVLNATILRPYEMDDPSTVVRVERLYANGSSTTWPYSAFAELHRSGGPDVEASHGDSVRLGEAVVTQSATQPILFVSGGFLSMLGGRASLGRTLEAGDDRPGASAVVVISHAFWTRHLNSDASIVGRTIPLGGGSATVVGVIRPKFSGPMDNPPSLWAPFATYSALYGGAALGPSSTLPVSMIARTPAGQEGAVQARLSSVASGLPPIGFEGASDIPPEATTGVQFESAGSPMSGADAGALYAVIAVIFIVLALVLALACANVANLLLAGASSRAREFGVRIAMGASRRRLMRQLLTESVLIGAVAGAVGFLLSMWMVPAVARIVGLSPSQDVMPDLTVMLFTTVIALVAGLGAGLAPARHGARSDVAGIIKAQSMQSGTAPKVTRLRKGFIGFQAAASMLLLVTAALFLRAALHVTRVDLGFEADRLVTASAAFPQPAPGSSGDSSAAVASYWRTAVDRVGAIPSVQGVSLASSPPFSGLLTLTRLTLPNGSPYTVTENRTDAAYFRTAGFRIVRGRAYTAEEVAANAPVAIVSESLVRDFLTDVEPIGAPLSRITSATSRKDAGITIIGVVADAVTWRLRDGGNGALYRPIDPKGMADARLVIRTTRPGGVARDVESALTSINPSVRPTLNVMANDVDRFKNEPRILAGLSGAVALLALVLSVLGIFGVTSFVVGQRSQEMSVRMAIGASAGDVVRLLIRQNIAPVAAGLIAGLAIALLGSRVLTGALSGISPYDAVAIVPAVLVLSLTALAAVAGPARRAARTDPASVLRQ